MSTKDVPPTSSADALTSTATAVNPNPGPDCDNYPWVQPLKEAVPCVCKSTCEIPCCRKTPKDCPDGILLFEMPEDLNKRAEWMKNICNVPIVLKSTLEKLREKLQGTKVCSLHFDPAEIEESEDEDESSATGGKKVRLVNEAIPTRNLRGSPVKVEN